MKYSNGNYDGPNGMHGVPAWRIVGFSLTDASTNCYLFMMSMIAYYLTGYVWAGVVLAGSFSMIMRIFDGVTDPFVGMVVDRFNSKLGKNRPFMFIGNITMFISSFLMFHLTVLLPEGGVIRLVWFFFINAIYYLGYTCQAIIVKSGQTCLTNDPRQRPLCGVSMGIFNTMVFALGQLWVSGTLAPKYGSMASAGLFQEMQLVLGIISFLLMCISAFSLAPKDNSKYFGLGSGDKVTFKDYADVILHNRAIQMLVVAASTDKLALQAKTSTITLILFGIVAGNYAVSGLMSTYTSVVSILFLVMGLGVIATRMGQKRALVVGSLGAVVGNILLVLLWWFGDATTLSLPGDGVFAGLTFFTVAFFVLQLFTQGMQQISSSVVITMTADCADYETYRSGKYVPGLIGTLFSFVDKLVSSFAPLIASVMLAAIGFKTAMPDLNTPLTTELKAVGIFLSYGMLIICCALNLIAMKFYPLDKAKMSEIQDEIAAIKAKAQARA